jgi:hypothetical protein
METETWHQRRARQRAYKLRDKPAHILRGDFIVTGLTLCGRTHPAVWISAAHRAKPENKCCAHCKRIADNHSTLAL